MNLRKRFLQGELHLARIDGPLKGGLMQAEIERLNQTWNGAWLEKDATTVEALMAPEYAYVAPNGQVLDRAAILGIIRSPGYRLERGMRTEVR